MKEEDKRKEQFMNESTEGHQRTAELQALEAQSKWVEDKYKRIQDHFVEIFNSSKDAIGYATLEGILLDVNGSFLKLTGYSREELLDRKKNQDITPEEYHEFEAQIVEKILSTGEPVEYEKEYIRKDCSRVPVLLTVFMIKGDDGKPLALAAIIKDTTERKQAEYVLRESEERYRTLIENTFDLIAEVGVNGRFLYVNPKHEEILGYEPGELIDRSIFEFIHQDDYHAARLEFKRALKSFSSGRLIHRYKHKNGEWLWLESTGKPFRTPTGNIRGFLVSRDITERKMAEKALKESEERYRNLFEDVPTGMYRTTPDGRILMANPALIRMLGYSSFDELALRNLEREGFAANLPRNKFKELLEQEGEVIGLEFTWVRHDGTLVHVRESARAIRGEGGTILYYEGTVEDVTERRILYEKSQQQTEELKSSHEQLRALSARLQSVREEEMTRIAREIHDELGQTLTGLQMSLSWLDKKLSQVGNNNVGSGSVLLEEIANMSKLLDTAIQKVQQISAELRPIVLDELGLMAAIEWQVQEFQIRMGIRCKFTTHLENIVLDENVSTSIFRILQEALTNVARHSNATRVNINLREKGSNLILEVKDNGKGITKGSIFNPKSLGLIGIRERAILLGGKVKISGTPGKGTTITVQIPFKR